VIAPSHPGFGHSELPRGMSTVDDMSYFYLDLIEELGLRDLVVVGASFGGWIAAEIASKTCERLSRLVLIGAVGAKFGAREKERHPGHFFHPAGAVGGALVPRSGGCGCATTSRCPRRS